MSYYSERRETTRKFIEELAKEIKPLGYRVFLYDDGKYNCWSHIITPSDSWLYLGHNVLLGMDLSYQYQPSKDFGSGCASQDHYFSIGVDELIAIEKYGKNYSYKRKFPKHYESGLKALENSRNYDKLVEL